MSPKDHYNPQLDRYTTAPAPQGHTPEGIAFRMQQKAEGELHAMISERAKQPRRLAITCGLLFATGCTILGGIAMYVMNHPQEFPGLFLK